MPQSDEEIWLELAVLFFFDPLNPPTADKLGSVANKLKLANWNRKKAEEVLVGIVAPHAKRWLGYGLPLAIGEGIDFWEKHTLIPKMKATAQVRAKYEPKKFPFFYFIMPDFLNRRILKRRGYERLLDLLH